MALSAEERARRKHRRELFNVKQPSAVDRLAALGDPNGPAARRLALWAEHEAEMEVARKFICSFGQEGSRE